MSTARFNPEQLPRIEITSPEQLADERWGEINELRFAYFASIMTGRSFDDVRSFRDMTTRAVWNDPNTAVGSPLTRSGQVFARTHVVSAFSRENDELLGYVYAADNVSSHRSPEIAARVERWAKLHVPLAPFSRSHYRVIREMILPSTERSDPLMIAAALKDAQKRPVVAYQLGNTGARELDAQLLLQSMGLARDASFDPVPIFEDETGPSVIKFHAPSAADVVERLVGPKGEPMRDFVECL